MEFPARPLAIASAARIYGAILRDKDIADDDVLAARATHARGEPRIEDVVLRAWQQGPDEPVGTLHGHHHPTGGITAAGKAPVTGDTITISHRFGRATGRIESARRQDIRPTSEEFLLGRLREVANPPVVHRPEGIAPGSRAAGPAQLPGHVKSRVIFEAEAAIALRVAKADETRGNQ